MLNNKSNYFDLFTTGIGYLNRVKQIAPDEGLPFLVVQIAALRGSTDNVGKTYFDCRVSGKVTAEWVTYLMSEVDRGAKVLIRFRMSDLVGDTFTFLNGPRKGMTGVSLRTRLIGVDWATVDGKSVRPDMAVA